MKRGEGSKVLTGLHDSLEIVSFILRLSLLRKVYMFIKINGVSTIFFCTSC